MERKNRLGVPFYWFQMGGGFYIQTLILYWLVDIDDKGG